MTWWSDLPAARPTVLREAERDRAEGGWTWRASPAASQARPTLEELLARARQEGEEAGRLQLAEEAALAQDEARRRVASGLAALEGCCRRLEDARAEALEVLQDDVARLALELLEELLGAELRLRETPALDAARRALVLAAPEMDVRLRMHPADAAEIAALAERRSPERPWGPGAPWYGMQRSIQVVPDPSVEQGGCICEVGPARIDAQISSALGRVREALGLSCSAGVVQRAAG